MPEGQRSLVSVFSLVNLLPWCALRCANRAVIARSCATESGNRDAVRDVRKRPEQGCRVKDIIVASTDPSRHGDCSELPGRSGICHCESARGGRGNRYATAATPALQELPGANEIAIRLRRTFDRTGGKIDGVRPRRDSGEGMWGLDFAIGQSRAHSNVQRVWRQSGQHW